MDFIEVIKFGTNKQCIKIFNAIYDIYDVVLHTFKKIFSRTVYFRVNFIRKKCYKKIEVKHLNITLVLKLKMQNKYK